MNYEDYDAPVPHYYGDIVRLLFLASAVIMLVGLPGISNYLSIPTAVSVVAMLVLGLAAGLTNPKLLWESVINAVIASGGLVIFETYAVTAFRQHGAADKFFISNMVLGFIFLFAVYFSVKTVRGLLLRDK